MLQRLLDRLQRRQRIVQLLLARQPMLRRTVVGRRMVRAFGPLLAAPVADDRVAFAPNMLPLPAEPQRTIPAVADLLPEPLIDSPAQSQASDRPRAVTPPVVVRQPAVASQPVPAANPQIIPGPDARQSVPQAVRSQQQAIPDSRSAVPPAFSALPAEPFVGDAVVAPVPISAQSDEPGVAAPAPISALGEQAVLPDATASLVSGPLSSVPPIVPAPANPDPALPSASDAVPLRRRRAQITELPVAPEVARSLAQAAGERYTPPPATTQGQRSGAGPDQAVPSPAVPPQKTAAELFTNTPVRSPQEWARMLFGETNTAAQPTPVADPQPEPTLATEPAVADVVPARTMLPAAPEQVEQVEQVEFAANTRPMQPTQPTPIADPVVVAGMDLPSAVLEQQAVPANAGLSEPTPIPAVSVSGASESAPIPAVSVSAPNEPVSVPPVHDVQPLRSAPLAPTVEPSALSLASATVLPAAGSPAPAVSAPQHMVAQVSEVLRNEAQAQPAQPHPVQSPADPTMPPRTDTASVSLAQADVVPVAAEERVRMELPGSLEESPVNAPTSQESAGVLPEVQAAPVASVPVAQSAADPASVLPAIGAPAGEEPTAPSPREQTPSRRSRFEEIPASARQPAPQPVAPSGERKLNPRPWIPQPPPEIPQISEEMFQQPGGRSAQDWAKLLFEATNPNAWGRQPQPAADPQPQPQQPSVPDLSPAIIDRPAAIPSVQQAAQQPAQRQDTNRPIAAPVGRTATETAVPRRQSAAPTQPQAMPLRDSTRRFLRPIVGIDPGDVRIYRGAEGARMTEAFRAEGLSHGDAIALGPGNEDESRPETLGLLAHELTHAAQQQDARFVPPIVASADRAVAPAASAEQVARAAERQAVGAARRFIAPVSAGAQMRIPGPTAASAAPSIPGTNNLFGDVRSPQATPDRTHWGDLPAPWEPLPDWIGGPAPEPGMANSGSLPSVPNPGLPAATVTANTAVPAVPATYLAEIDRAIPEGEAVAPPEQQQQAAPAADLDAMARQVYGLLKQRLAAERRRLGS